MAGTIVAMGGISWEDEERLPLEDYWLGLTAAERPRVLVVPTAVAEKAEMTLAISNMIASGFASRLSSCRMGAERLAGAGSL